MKTTIKRAVSGALACCLLALSPPLASALEYRYDADLYDNHFYTPTSSNHALDLDSRDDSGGSTIVVPSDSMDTDADQTTSRTGSPIIPVGSYIDPWGSAVEKQIDTDETLNGLEGLSFNWLEGMNGGSTTAVRGRILQTSSMCRSGMWSPTRHRLAHARIGSPLLPASLRQISMC